jgi:serine/threonine protein kinase
VFTSGQILQSRYQLQKQLGHTVAGRQTWLAENVNDANHELVVIKLLVFNTEFNWDNLKLFEREAQVLQNINHERIPRYRDYFLVEKEPDSGLSWWCLVQDYIPGKTLQELLANGKRFSEDELKKIATEILQILTYLHQLNPPVLHRDIKPSNLIMGEDQQIYVVDFGAVQDKMAVTRATFTVVGTIGYTPMEQFWGRAVPASDLYGLGATLIHLVTGVAPADLPQNNLRIEFVNQEGVSKHFVNWIRKLTEPALEKRFTTANEALEALARGFNSIPQQKHLFSINNSINRVRPFLVVTKNSPEELEIYRYKEPNKYQQLIVIFVLILFFIGFLRVAGIVVLTLSFWVFLRWTLLHIPINEQMRSFLNIWRNQKFNLTDKQDFGGYIYFNASDKFFKFQNKWFGQFKSGAEFIKSIRSMYVCQTNENRPNHFFETDMTQNWQVVIRTDNQRIRLSWNLNEEECAWLVNEIQTWLDQV